MKETIKNLSKAFIGESQARNRYSFYAKRALKEGYEQMSDIFLLTAENEREHASWLLKLINQLKEDENDIIVEASTPTTLSDSTEDNLKAAIAGENHEHTEMYPEFADTAGKEGLTDIAKRLRAIAIAEKHHEERFKKLLKEIQDKTVFEKEKEVSWVCRKCGYVHDGKTPPDECPSCGHEENFFEVKNEDY